MINSKKAIFYLNDEEIKSDFLKLSQKVVQFMYFKQRIIIT